MRRVTSLLAALATITLLGVQWSSSQSCDGRRLVGLWVTDPAALGGRALTFQSDGTGIEASGLGIFYIHWRPRDEAGGAVRVRIRYTGEMDNAFGKKVVGFKNEDWDLKVEFLGPDVIRIDRFTVLYRK